MNFKMLFFSIKGNITDFWLNISSGVSVQFLVTISEENQNDLVTNHPSIYVGEQFHWVL